jgi:hypothetical protein
MLTEQDKKEIVNHILNNLESVDKQVKPWPHYVFNQFFPESYYQLLKDNFPHANQGWRSLSHNDYGARQVIFLKDEEKIKISGEQKSHWEDFYQFMNSQLFEILLRKNGLIEYIDKARLEIQIIRDSIGYKIPPHCDTFKDKRHKLLTILIYFPISEELSGYGTELYTRNIFRRYKKVKQAPFLNNTALMFHPTYNVTWHGVSEITEAIPPRTSLQVFIKLRQ